MGRAWAAIRLLIKITIFAVGIIALGIVIVYLIKTYWISNDQINAQISLFMPVILILNNFYGTLLMVILLGYALFNLPLRTWSKTKRNFIFFHYMSQVEKQYKEYREAILSLDSMIKNCVGLITRG